MPRYRRVASAIAIAALLALNLACPGPPPGPPPVETCSGAPSVASVDALEVSAHFATGGQGATMIVCDVRWLGADVPACASADFVLRNAEGDVFESRSFSLSTVESDGGRASETGVYFIVDGVCRASVEVTSYGHTVVVEAINTDWPCDQDAGPASDAGPLPDGAAPTPDAAVSGG